MKVTLFAFFVKRRRSLVVLLGLSSFAWPVSGLAASKEEKPPVYRPPGSAYRPPGVKTPVVTTKGEPSKPVIDKKPAPAKPTPSKKAPQATVSKTTKAASPLPPEHQPITGKLYVVRPGDTLWRIAGRHGTSINAIRAANHLRGETVAVGQSLLIPDRELPESRPAAVAAPARKEVVQPSGAYVVKPGDTFTKIAREANVSFDALKKANPGIQPELLRVGQSLQLPKRVTTPSPAAAIAATTASPAIPGTNATTEQGWHVVQPGESLGTIAQKYRLTTVSLATANRLEDVNRIRPGQRLVVPALTPETSRDHNPPLTPQMPVLNEAAQLASAPAVVPPPAPPPVAVESTPAVSAPAPVEEAKPMLAESLAPPQPTPSPVPPVVEVMPKKTELPPASRGIVAYRLEQGEDIHTVATQFGTTAERIREINKLQPDQPLRQGDEIVVPAPAALSLN